MRLSVAERWSSHLGGEKHILETYGQRQLQPVKGRPFTLSSCVIPCYKIIPIKNYIRAQDDIFLGFYRLLEKFINNLLRIHS